MFTGDVLSRARVARFVEFLDARTNQPFERREATERDDAAYLAANLPTHAVAFRELTRVVTTATVGDVDMTFASDPIESGPWYCVGDLVGREYLLSLASDSPINLGQLNTMVESLEAAPGTRIIRLSDRDFRGLEESDIAVDRGGRILTDPLGAPEGWQPVTVFEGNSFFLGVFRSFLGANTFRLGDIAPGHARVSLMVFPDTTGIVEAVREAVRGTPVTVDPDCGGAVRFSVPADIFVRIDPERTLRLAWNGQKLTAVLART